MVNVEDLRDGLRLRVIGAPPNASKANGDCYVNGMVWPVRFDPQKGEFRIRCCQSWGESYTHDIEMMLKSYPDRFELADPEEGPW